MLGSGGYQRNEGRRSAMVILKACPRCRGDLNSDRDIYGEYLECVQCGYMQDRDSGQRSSGNARHGAPSSHID